MTGRREVVDADLWVIGACSHPRMMEVERRTHWNKPGWRRAIVLGVSEGVLSPGPLPAKKLDALDRRLKAHVRGKVGGRHDAEDFARKAGRGRSWGDDLVSITRSALA